MYNGVRLASQVILRSFSTCILTQWGTGDQVSWVTVLLHVGLSLVGPGLQWKVHESTFSIPVPSP